MINQHTIQLHSQSKQQSEKQTESARGQADFGNYYAKTWLKVLFSSTHQMGLVLSSTRWHVKILGWETCNPHSRSILRMSASVVTEKRLS